MSNRIVGPVAKDLIAAKARIENIENWCQGGYRKGARRCAAGAFGATDSNGIPREQFEAAMTLGMAANELYNKHYVNVNDRLGHTAILSCFDHAIQRALSEGR